MIADGAGQRLPTGDAGELQMVELGRPGEEVHVALDEAREHRGTGGIDDAGARNRPSP